MEELLRSCSHDPVLAVKKYIANMNAAGLNASPPCKLFRDLCHVSELLDCLEDVEAATSKEGLKAIKDSQMKRKNALADLLTTAKRALSKLDAAITSIGNKAAGKKAPSLAATRKALAEKAAEKNKGTADGVGVTTKVMVGQQLSYETCALICNVGAVPLKERSMDGSIVLGSPFSELNLDIPQLFAIDPTIVAAKCTNIVMYCNTLLAKYKGSVNYQAKKREHRTLNESAFAEVDAIVKFAMKNAKPLPPSIEKNNKTLFALAGGSVSAHSETAQLATLRLQTKGTRNMFLVKTLDLADYIRIGCKKERVVPKDLHEWMKQMNAEAIQELHAFLKDRKSNDGPFVYQVAHSPSEIAYVPAGYVMLEEVPKGSDVVGVRVQMTRQEDLHILEQVMDFIDT